MAVNTYALTTLNNVKSFMGMTGSTSDTDDLIEDLISRVSVLFESYMDRNILSREYEEEHDGGGKLVLFPKQQPITTISGIWDDQGWEWADTTLIDSDEYRVAGDNYITFKNTILLNYSQNIKIIYTAGYSVTPLDLEQAVIIEVSRAYKNRNQVDVTATTLSDGSISFTAKTFLPLTVTTLNKYKKVNIV